MGPDLDKAGRDGGKRFSGAMASALKTGAATFGGILAAGGIAKFFTGAIGEASDLSETLSKSSIIFGKNAASIERFGDRAAKSLGLSKVEAIEFAAQFGDMFSQIGFGGDQAAKLSKSVVQMAADLGSFNNLPTEDVAGRIAAAFRGEYDSLQLLIPNINAARVEQAALAETGKKSAKQLNAQEKAAAVLAIVSKDGARAQGDFARTSTGLANQQKILSAQTKDLQAKVGKALVPALASGATVLNEKLFPALGDVGSALADLGGFVKDNSTTFKVLAAIIGTALLPSLILSSVSLGINTGLWIANSAAMLVATAYVRAYQLVAKTGAAAQFLLNAAMSANPIALVVIAIAALVAGLIYAYKNSETFRKVVTTAFEAVKVGFAAVGQAFRAVYNAVIGPVFALIIDAVAVQLKVIGKLLGALGKVPGFGWAKDAAKAIGAASDAASKLADNVRNIPPTKPKVDAKQLYSANTIAERLGSNLDKNGKKKSNPKTSTPGLGSALTNVSKLGDRLDSVGKKHARPQISITGLGGALQGLSDFGRKLDALAAKKSKVKVGNNAMGTNDWRGGLTWVGEQGPELINLQKGAQVIPNHRIGQVVGSRASISGQETSSSMRLHPDDIQAIGDVILAGASAVSEGTVDDALGFGGQWNRMDRG